MSNETSAQQSEPKVVYHYTSIETMMRIVECRQMRATSIRYLNDTRERDGFLDKAIELMPILAADPSMDPEAFSDYLQYGKFSSNDPASIPFVASFSSEGDSLPQWRSYCPAGNGISIGFNVSCLKTAKVHGDTSLTSNGTKFDVPFPISFAAVQYFRPTNQDEIEASVRALYKRAYNMPERLSTNPHHADIPLSQAFRVVLEDEAAIYKDAAFVSEAEFRLLLGGVYWKSNLMKFRANRSTLVPYVEFDIPNTDGSSEKEVPWDAISEVTVGPTPNSMLTVSAVNAYFTSLGMPVKLRSTDVPYRDW